MGGLRKPSDRPTVGFAEALVTGVSRPLTTYEHVTLYNFETHASDCDDCHSPLKVFKAGELLCEEGHGLAVKVSDLLFKLKRDGRVYATSRRENQDVSVELPANYNETISLFKAIQKSEMGILEPPRRQKPKSFDRYYDVKPRIRMDALLDPEPQPRSYYAPRKSNVDLLESSLFGTSVPPHSTRSVEPTARPEKKKRQSKPYAPDPRRGSLYLTDLMTEKVRAKEEACSQYEYDWPDQCSQRFWAD